ncbi:uncharacterized protein K444DRAFT_8941 [Hyaloscypha bicolor E]|uniref:Uncharacterized protein n=1 Tax=Hyaloscypha bicolor E TaxID=1095630 RepID=A0A2J6TW62_9HELO|nr:uncharacterized protein K444DRAFT_8941 [Hyaloscypha bicolor E]PMD67198.1 hypothetical protein K444DRAFT_8941 [Hyaloscypha bicolor E]
MMLRVTGSRLDWTPAQARGPPRLPSVGPSDVRTTPARDQHFLGCVSPGRRAFIPSARQLTDIEIAMFMSFAAQHHPCPWLWSGPHGRDCNWAVKRCATSIHDNQVPTLEICIYSFVCLFVCLSIYLFWRRA